MGMFSWLRRPVRSVVKYIGIDDLWKRGAEHLAVRDRLVFPYEQVGAVYSAVTAVRTSVASINTEVYAAGDTDEEPIPDHPFFDMTHMNASPLLRGSQIYDATQTYLETWGYAFWCMDDFRRGGAGNAEVPHRVFVPEPWRMYADRAEEDPDEPIREWRYTGRWGPRTYSVEQVAFFRFFHPNPRLRFWEGLPPLTAARLDAQLNFRSSRFQDRFYNHGGFPPFYIYTPSDVVIDQKQRDEAKEKFEDKYLGEDNAWRPPFMGQGAELRSIAISQRDAEWIAGSKLTRDNILSIFGVPPAVAGFMEDANRANSIEQKRFFWTRTIPPKTGLIKAVVDADVLDRWWPGTKLKWRTAERMAQASPEDVREAINAADKMIGRGVPPKTAYEFLGLHFDTTDMPWLETGWLPINVAPAEQLAEPVVIEEGATNEAGYPTDPNIRGRMWKRYESVMVGLARTYLGAYRGFLRWYERQIQAELKDAAALETWEGLAELVVFAKVAASEWSKELQKRILPSTTASISAGYKSAMADLDDEGRISAKDMNALRSERMKSANRAVRNLNDRLDKKLKEADDKSAATSEFFAQYAQGQATVVADNETAAAFNQARAVAFKDKKVAKHEWLSQRDDAVRESHLSEDGHVVKFGKRFPVTRLLYPHDSTGAASEVIGCRCVTLPVKEK